MPLQRAAIDRKSVSISTTGVVKPALLTRWSRFRSPIKRRGSHSAMACVNSSTVHHPFRAATMPPRLTVAQKPIAHSAQLAAKMATRSPLRIPYSS